MTCPGHVTVKSTLCNRDLELTAVSIRPYYLAREFSHVIVLAVYIPPRADPETARETICGTTSALRTRHPEALVIITGDFNHVTLDSSLPTMVQCVDCPTRKNRTIDLFYTNAKEAYTATPLPPLGKSDHNLVYLQPTYIPLVKRLPATTRQVRRWSPEEEEMLRNCFQTTDWDVIVGSHGEDIEGAAQCFTDYMNFCVDTVAPVRTIRCYPNNKPWVTKEVKAVLNRKKRAFRSKNEEEMRKAQKEVRLCLREAKEAYRRKLEKQLGRNQVREVWNGMRTITRHGKGRSTVEGNIERANELNSFFNRFSSPTTPGSSSQASPGLQTSPGLQASPGPTDRSTDAPSSCASSPSTPATSPEPTPRTAKLNGPTSTTGLPTSPQPPAPTTTETIITADLVTTTLRRLRPYKAAGPDKVSPRLLRACASELGGPLQQLFNLSLRLGRVPSLWKTSCIVPVPKKGRPTELNDHRPVASTAHSPTWTPGAVPSECSSSTFRVPSTPSSPSSCRIN
ncbi:uncharacterized protein [Antennarius striatus]|uniref:uncharacterized protein n=1 Tax=Antennarius striatus TaxID=241820 RepID=UPI0035AF58DD